MDTTVKGYSPDLIIAIFRNAKPDFAKLDLRPLGLVVVPVSSDMFNEYILVLNKERYEIHIDNIERNIIRFKTYKHHLYAIVPVHYQKVHTNTYMKIRMALLLMFPTDFNIIALIDFSKSGESFNNNITRTFDYMIQRISDGSDEFRLSIEEEGGNEDDVSAFVIHFVERFKELEDFEIAYQSYIKGYDHLDIRMTFVNWFMAFDALSSGNTEITHRLSRIVAVLNSSDVATGETIFKNFGEFYNLRSAIVHGSSMKEYEKALKVYYKPVQALLSRTLIEIVQQTFTTRDDFERIIRQSGFGTKDKLSLGYKEFNVNPKTKALAKAPAPKFKTAKKGVV